MKKEGIEIKHIDLKIAKKLHKDLEKMLEKADNRKIFQYDINAHSDFCAEVVKMMDVMVGIVREKYELSGKKSRSKSTTKRQLRKTQR